MEKLQIEIKVVPNDCIRITEINGALGIGEVPKEYHEHVPYMLWRTDYLFINYLGGLDHIRIGSNFSQDKWHRLTEYIVQCETKLHKINHGQTITCPFCNRPDFDKAGLKHHLLDNQCEVFNNY